MMLTWASITAAQRAWSMGRRGSRIEGKNDPVRGCASFEIVGEYLDGSGTVRRVVTLGLARPSV